MAEQKKETPPDLDGEFQNNPYALARFVIDGYKVHVNHSFVKNKLEKIFYINGWHKGKWYDKDLEENKRFAYSHERYMYNAKFRKSMKSFQGKWGIDDVNKKVEYRKFITRASLKTIIKQWCEREINKSIVLVDREGNELFKYK